MRAREYQILEKYDDGSDALVATVRSIPDDCVVIFDPVTRIVRIVTERSVQGGNDDALVEVIRILLGRLGR
jgi:hypothetical protein